LIRRTVPLGKSIGPLSYLISVGLIATWIIIVFFGAGLAFLIHRSAKPVSAVSGSAYLVAPAAQSVWVPEAWPGGPTRTSEGTADESPGSGPDPPLTTSSKPDAVEADRPLAAPSEAKADRTVIDVGSQVAPADLTTAAQPTDELAPALRSETQPPSVTGPQVETRHPHTASARKGQPANTRTVQRHAPVQAIQELLQKHSDLLK
jgi:hypothetical protein